MDDLENMMTNQLEKISQMEDLIALHFRKDKIHTELQKLEKKVSCVKIMMNNCNELIKNYDRDITTKYQLLKTKLDSQIFTVLNVLKELEKRSQVKQLITNSAKIFNATPLNIGSISMENTPNLRYSPFTPNLRPLCIQFDFETTITNEQFEEVPKYMRGRDTVDCIRDFLDSVIIPCFAEKYQLLRQKRNSLKNSKDIELWKLYQQQVLYFPGQKFITQGDISRKVNKLVDKKMSARITVLRHLKIIQEQRKSSTVCYIWTAN